MNIDILIPDHASQQATPLQGTVQGKCLAPFFFRVRQIVRLARQSGVNVGINLASI